jgi:toxin ParE1/3/4
MAELTWSIPSLRQLDEILDYIALDKPLAAKQVAKLVFDSTENAERFKLIGRKIPQYPVENYRQLWIRPCWIYYRISGEDVFILHVRRAESDFRIENLEE